MKKNLFAIGRIPFLSGLLTSAILFFSFCISFAQQPLSVSISSSMNVSCNGGADGSASATALDGYSPYIYSWSPGGQTTTAISNLEAGNYTITVTDDDASTATATVTITEPPAIIVNLGADVTQCGGMVMLDAGNAGSSYAWSNASTAQTINVSVTGNYSVTVTNAASGCMGSDTVMVTINPLPTANAGSDVSMCAGGSTTLNGTGNGSFVWSPPTGLSCTTCPNPIASPTVTTTYTVDVMDAANGCTNTDIVTVNVVEILIEIDSIVSVSSCSANDGGIYITTSGGVPPYTYLWSPGGNTTEDISNLSPDAYTVLITDSFGCTTSFSQNIYVLPPPTPFSICITTVDSLSTGNIIIWDKPVSTTIDSFKIYRDSGTGYIPVVTIPYTALSTYTDNVNPHIHSYGYKISAISSGVESILSNSHQTIFLQVTLQPTLANKLTWNDYCGFPVTQYYILRDSTNTNFWVRIDSVNWGTNVYIDFFPPTDSANYRIEAVHPTGCTASLKNPSPMVINLNSSKSNVFKVIDSTLTSVSFINNEIIVSVYPNPSSGVFTLTSTINHQPSTIKIYNVLGEKIHQSSIINNKSEIDLRGYAKGVYHLQLLSRNKIVNKKIIIN